MVNINELRKKYEQIQNAQQGGGNAEFLKKFFMMEEGTSVVRILPGKEDQEFYAETAIHRIDDRNYHCPRVKGDDCPVCDLYYRLWKIEDDNETICRICGWGTIDADTGHKQQSNNSTSGKRVRRVNRDDGVRQST